jgi:hypothetical protein
VAVAVVITLEALITPSRWAMILAVKAPPTTAEARMITIKARPTPLSLVMATETAVVDLREVVQAILFLLTLMTIQIQIQSLIQAYLLLLLLLHRHRRHRLQHLQRRLPRQCQRQRQRLTNRCAKAGYRVSITLSQITLLF